MENQKELTVEQKIRNIMSDIEAYKQAIDDAYGALSAAEIELSAEIEAAMEARE